MSLETKARQNTEATMTLAESLRRARRVHATGYAMRVVALIVVVGTLWLASLMFGETTYSLGEVVRVVAGQTVPGASFSVGELRLPRASIAVAVGLAFGMAGMVFQTLLRNQLASPDIIGISSAAAAAGVTAIVLFQAGAVVVGSSAMAVSLLVAVAIYVLATGRGRLSGGHGRGFSGARLILIGIGVGTMLQSWTTYVLSRAAAWDMPTATRWLTGSLNNVTFERGWPVLVVAAVAVPLAAVASHQLACMRLGQDMAKSLGIRAAVVRVGLMVGAVLLVAVATSVCGPVAFVAFMSGPIAARLFRPGPALIIPAGLVGAILVLGADLAGQFLFGTRYPVGVVTGALGAPFLIYLLIRSRA